MKFAFALLALTALTGCTGDSPFAIKPIYTRLHGDELSADHSPDDRQGWDDGCYTGYAVYGTNVYKSFYGFRRDTSKVGNSAYETEWYNGYNYCRQQANMMANEKSILD